MLATLAKYRGRFKAEKFNWDECYDHLGIFDTNLLINAELVAINTTQLIKITYATSLIVMTMNPDKIEKIKGITEEVREFHPLLRVLFSRLPYISNVEYTHGQQEMGADFVLTKNDPTLDAIEYIGCIVKIGQIKQDHSEINRQIEECELDRTVDGGVRKIFLSEIWVVSNGNITNAAQQKIHHTYKNKNIKFLSTDKLTNLIERYYPEYWDDTSISVGEYLREVRVTANNLGSNTSLLDPSQSDIYIPQSLVKTTTKRTLQYNSRHTLKKECIEEIIEFERYILIESSMGTGKSTLLSRLARLYTETEQYSLKKILPILITARDLIDVYKSDIRTLIQNIKQRSAVSGQNGFLLLIDALDELKITSDERLEFLKNLYKFSSEYSDLKIIVTMRNIDDPEFETEIDKFYSRYMLCTLTVKQVIDIVDKFCKNTNVKIRLSRDLDKSHLFRVLPKTPISAILLAKLLNENVQEIPSTMTELYSKYMELVLGRWDMDKGLQSQREYDIINNVTINISQFILNNSLIEISLGDAKQIFDEYTDSRNLQIDKASVFKKLTKKTEIYRFNSIKNTIGFRHRTFAEYFFAMGLMRDQSALINEEIYDLYWATSYFFYIGMLRDCPQLLEAIDKIEFTSDMYRLSKVFNNGNLLLAAYLTPYDFIKNSVRKSFYDVANLYIETVTKESKSPLRQLSRIQLLCIFTHYLCDTYGYDFFTDALEEYSLDLCTNPTLDDLGYVELFLINSVLFAEHKSDAYDMMIKNYGSNIPLQIQAGIIEHSSDKKTTSPIIKGYIKKLHKKFRANISLKQALIAMYEEPVDKMIEKGVTFQSNNVTDMRE